MYFIFETGPEIKSRIIYNSISIDDINRKMTQIANSSGIQIMSNSMPSVSPVESNYVKIINENCILLFKSVNTGIVFDHYTLMIYKRIEVIFHDISNVDLL